jgi:hypothetical protein
MPTADELVLDQEALEAEREAIERAGEPRGPLRVGKVVDPAEQQQIGPEHAEQREAAQRVDELQAIGSWSRARHVQSAAVIRIGGRGLIVYVPSGSR